MRVNEKVRKTVIFVGSEANGTFVPYGTGFMCDVRDRTSDLDLGYNFVGTAQHVLDRIPEGAISVRVNRNDGGASVIRCNRGTYRSQRIYDLALLPIDIGPDIYDFLSLPLDRDEVEHLPDGWEMGIGDEVCVSGLYTSHHGKTRNIPVVRIGHLAAMPEEPIRTDFGEVEGYLIEVHSIAGLSGSPVFATVPPVRWNNVRGGLIGNQEPQHPPIGVLLGHHVIETKEDEILVPRFSPTVAGDPSSGKNTGFGVVVPIERLYEMVESEVMQQAMKAASGNERVRRQKEFRRDAVSGSEPPTTDENPQHREDFNRLLGEAVPGNKSDR